MRDHLMCYLQLFAYSIEVFFFQNRKTKLQNLGYLAKLFLLIIIINQLNWLMLVTGELNLLLCKIFMLELNWNIVVNNN